jgi:serine/threonine protein kinase
MVEKRALPKKEIEAMEKKAEKEGRTPAEEDCYEYVYRLIDFGLSFKIDGTESLEKRSSDMFSLGALMPCFLFGNNVIKILKISYSMSLYDLWTNLKNAAKKELKEGKNDFEQKKIQLILEILALEKDLNRLSPFFQQKIDKIKKEIEAKSQKYKRKYGKNLQSCKTKFEGSLRKKIDEKRNQYVMDGFLEANARMKKAIGLAYPENVLEQLAQFTANCISEDPKQRPTAEEGYQIITNLFFALMTVKK